MASPLRWARVTVIGVFVLGLVVVVGPALGHLGSLFRDPFVASIETKTVQTFDATGVKTGTEVTTGPAGGSMIERSMAAGGVLLLRLAVVSAAAYLAGALVFRTLSGTFPSEIAGVKFAAEAAAGLGIVETNIRILEERVAHLTDRLDAAGVEILALRATATEGVAGVAQLGEKLDTTLDTVEQLVSATIALNDELRDLKSRPAQ